MVRTVSQNKIDEVSQSDKLSYDSFQNAYKQASEMDLVSISIQDDKCETLKSCKSSIDVKSTRSFSSNSKTNDHKLEVKNMLCSNENKISNLIKKFANS